MRNSTNEVRHEQSVELGRVRGQWSASPLREAGTLLGVLRQQGLAGSGLVNAFEKWAPEIVGSSRADISNLYREQTGRDLSDYILTQKADRVVRYGQFPPEAEVFRQIILKSRASDEPKPNGRGSKAAHGGSARREARTPALYRVHVKVATTRGNHDGTVLLAARNGRQAEKRAQLATARFFNVPTRAARTLSAERCPLASLLVIDGRVMKREWVGHATGEEGTPSSALA